MNWITTTRNQISTFEILYCNWGTWKKRGEIKSTTKNRYEWVETKPFWDLQLFKLKIIDSSGLISYSGILRAKCFNQPEPRPLFLSPYPNPTRDIVTLQISGVSGKNLVSVSNEIGIIIFEETINVPSFIFSTQGWKNGSYTIILKNETGVTLREKLFVLR